VIEPDRRERLRAALLGWYDGNRRDLPWRAEIGGRADPYRVWVSEVMLQQTRVDTVRPYFERWMKLFPDPHGFAAASLDEVLKAWEGLGYYSRARNLHRAVREVVDRYDGELPDDPAAFRELPGVGRYTAGAVMSIAFQREVPVVDGNVRRVLARILNDPAPTDATLWRVAADLVVGPRPGDLNQAMMELGAMVCMARSPRCQQCPAADLCGAASEGTMNRIPIRRPRRRTPIEHYGVAVVTLDDRVLLVQRPEDGRFGGLWEFPAALYEEGESSREAAGRAAVAAWGAEIDVISPIGPVEHQLSHVRLAYSAYLARPAGGEYPAGGANDGRAWIRTAALEEFALPTAHRRIAALAEVESLRK
jgi:A/G-specific adenine glycosylase